MVNAYGGVLILADILLLIVKVIYIVLEATYRLLVPVEEKSVAGEIVLITGAGHGIGRELALKYASLGATVVCWDLNVQGNQETVDQVMKLGTSKAHGYQCDVSNREDVIKTAKKVYSEVGNVTILINNAGIMPCQPFLEHSPETIKKIFDVNVMAHFWMNQTFLPSMINNNHGHIVALSSMAGVTGIANLVPYCSSKFAVRGMMETLNDEVRTLMGNRESNVKFTTIYPYMVDTGLCKKPKIRFPSLMGIVPPKEAAAQIVTAQRRNYTDVSIPRCWMTVNSIVRNFPDKILIVIKNFFDCGVEATD